MPTNLPPRVLEAVACAMAMETSQLHKMARNSVSTKVWLHLPCASAIGKVMSDVCVIPARYNSVTCSKIAQGAGFNCTENSGVTAIVPKKLP